jgi:hypothetical protein
MRHSNLFLSQFFFTSAPTSVRQLTEQLKFSLIAQFVPLTEKHEEPSYQLVEFILDDNEK